MIEQNSKKDTLFTDPARRRPFVFDQAVSAVFDDMIVRSVPFYPEILSMIAELSAPFLMKQKAVLDLGCSTGNMIQLISEKHQASPLQFYAVDYSETMLTHAKEKLSSLPKAHSVEFIQSDLETMSTLPAASVIILNLVLQFITPESRVKILKVCYDSLPVGGALFLVEKLTCPESELEALFTTLYHNYKRRQGYSEEEILNKAIALNNVLRPFSLDQNQQLIAEAGFEKQDLFFRWYNFAGIIAIKTAVRQG